MGKSFKLVICFLLFIKIVVILTAFVYFFVWFMQFFDMELYSNFNSVHGSIPAQIDEIIRKMFNAKNQKMSFGYMYYSGILFAVYIGLKYVENRLRSFQRRIDDYEMEKALSIMLLKRKMQKKEQQEKEEKQEKREKQEKEVEDFKENKPINITPKFYALLEFDLIFEFSDGNKSVNKLKMLKKEYIKMLKEKIKDKYSTITFYKSDKLFMVSEDFSQLDTLIKDIRLIYNLFYELNNKKGLRTSLILSFWTDCKKRSMKYALKILKKINKLKNEKILICEKTLEKSNIECNKTPYGVIAIGGVEKEKEDGVLKVRMYSC